MGFWPMTLTPEIFTGNVNTVNDPYQSAVTPPIGTPYPNGARMPLGTPVYQTDASGRRSKYRYVRLNCTTPPGTFVGGGPVYWKDTTYTIVTLVRAESVAGENAIAGVLLNPGVTNGNYTLIQVSGYNAIIQVPTGALNGAAVMGGSNASQQTYISAFGTAPSMVSLAILIGNAVGNSAPGIVVVEDYGGI